MIVLDTPNLTESDGHSPGQAPGYRTDLSGRGSGASALCPSDLTSPLQVTVDFLLSVLKGFGHDRALNGTIVHIFSREPGTSRRRGVCVIFPGPRC